MDDRSVFYGANEASVHPADLLPTREPFGGSMEAVGEEEEDPNVERVLMQPPTKKAGKKRRVPGDTPATHNYSLRSRAKGKTSGKSIFDIAPEKPPRSGGLKSMKNYMQTLQSTNDAKKNLDYGLPPEDGTLEEKTGDKGDVTSGVAYV